MMCAILNSVLVELQVFLAFATLVVGSASAFTEKDTHNGEQHALGDILLEEPLEANLDMNIDSLYARDLFQSLIDSEQNAVTTTLDGATTYTLTPASTTTENTPHKSPPTPTSTASAMSNLTDSVPLRYVLSPGSSVRYGLSNITKYTDVYVTLNICGEPDDISNSTIYYANDGALSLYATDNSSNNFWLYASTNLGLASLTLRNVSADSVQVAISAPTARIKNTNAGNWTYEVAISTKKAVHKASTSEYLNLVDTDFAHALLVTDVLSIDGDIRNLTNNITDFNIYVYPAAASAPDGSMFRLSQSYCGISTGPALMNQNNALLSTTTRGQTDDELRGQIFLPGLNISSTYVAFLTKPNNVSDSYTSGGEVYQGVNFTTKSETNCQLIYDLEFCDSIAYAVPGNASLFTPANLSTYYDGIAQERYANFSVSLQQVSCNASTDAMYSVLRDCDDCAAAYKQWLCAVTAPRCTDWSKNDSFLYPRPVGSSRNPQINEFIRPGKYKEILPCIDMCYGLVQDCPATFGFVCPQDRDYWGFSYGTQSDDGDVTCSYPGAVYYKSVAAIRQLGLFTVGFSVASLAMFI